MVNVATLVKFGAIAVAMCVATTSAVDVAETPRLLQTTDESPPPPGNAPLTLAPETSSPAPSDTTTPSPSDTTAPAPTESPSPVPSTPEPTTVTPEPTTVTPEPTTVTPEPTTVTPAPTTVTPEPTTVTPVPTETPAPTTETPAPPVTTVPAPPVTTAPPPTEPPATTAPPPTEPPATTAPPPTDPPAPTTPTSPPEPSPTTPAPPTPTTPEPAPTTPTSPPEPTTPAPPTPTTTAPPPEPTTTAPPTPTTTAPPTPTTPTPEPSTSAPPLVPITVPPEVTDEPPATTKPGQPTTVPPKTPEPDDDGQATAPDVILFNATKTTAPPNVDPFKITDVGTDAPKPVVLDIRDNEDTTEKPKLYVRGDVKTDAPTATNSDGSAVLDADGNPSTSTNDASTTNIIGGRHRNSATTADAILSSSSASFHDFLRYASVAFAGISVALLLFFHYVSLDATLSWTSALWSPNTWEFLLYVGYLQQMGAVSQLTLLKTPYFVWDYADSFAWTNFLVQRSVSTADAARRRLETVVLGGVVAYADRIGIDETKVVFHAVVGFVVVFAVLLMLFFIIAVLAKRKAEQALDASNLHVSTQSVHKLRSASIRTLGLCVLIWFFALYPLSLYASFEISMEIQSKTAVASALLVSILALGVACFGVLAWSGRVIMQKSKDELLQFENIATWGSLYAEFSYRSRMFFVLTALVQIVSGILVGTMDADPTQLIIVMLVQVLYLVAVFVMTPFAEVLVLRFTYGLGALKVLNYGLAFAFLNSNGLSGKARNRVADAFIGINTLVIIAWFVRQLIVFSTYIRAWSVRSSFMEEEGRVNHLEDSTAKYETRTATDSEVYASVTTARHGDSNGLSSDDDFHRAPPPTAMTTREVGF